MSKEDLSTIKIEKIWENNTTESKQNWFFFGKPSAETDLFDFFKKAVPQR